MNALRTPAGDAVARRPRRGPSLLASLSLLALPGALAAGAAAAADLPDPTRPPLTQRNVQAGAPAATGAARTAPVLQSVLIGAGRKSSAIIDGRVLELGDTVDGMRLTRLTETAAVLTGPRGTRTLALTPGSDKQAASPTRLATEPAGLRRTGAIPPSLRIAEQK